MRDPETMWLVLRAQAGDREALETLLARARQPLFRYIAALVGDRTLAEDVLQDVLFSVYRKLAWLREPSLFAPWAYRIASRAAFRAMKRSGGQAILPVPDDLPAPDSHDGLSSIDRDALHRVIDKLSPASRAVIVLHYLEDLPISEVAAVLEIPAGTAKSRLAYGLRCAREALQ